MDRFSGALELGTWRENMLTWCKTAWIHGRIIELNITGTLSTLNSYATNKPESICTFGLAQYHLIIVDFPSYWYDHFWQGFFSKPCLIIQSWLIVWLLEAIITLQVRRPSWLDGWMVATIGARELIGAPVFASFDPVACGVLGADLVLIGFFNTCLLW